MCHPHQSYHLYWKIHSDWGNSSVLKVKMAYPMLSSYLREVASFVRFNGIKWYPINYTSYLLTYKYARPLLTPPISSFLCWPPFHCCAWMLFLYILGSFRYFIGHPWPDSAELDIGYDGFGKRQPCTTKLCENPAFPSFWLKVTD